MIIPDKKKAVGIILSRMSPEAPKAPEMEMSEENHREEIMKAIAADILEAMHSKSAHDLSNALCAFLEQHDLHEASESAKEEASEHEME